MVLSDITSLAERYTGRKCPNIVGQKVENRDRLRLLRTVTSFILITQEESDFVIADLSGSGRRNAIGGVLKEEVFVISYGGRRRHRHGGRCCC